MSKENHYKFVQEIRNINIEIDRLKNLKEDKIKNRNIMDYLYIDEEIVNNPFDKNVSMKHDYRIYAPSPEGYNLSTYNIVEICKVTKINRKSLKKVWVNQLGGTLISLFSGETVTFTTKAAAEMALEWLISRLMIKKLSK